VTMVDPTTTRAFTSGVFVDGDGKEQIRTADVEIDRADGQTYVTLDFFERGAGKGSERRAFDQQGPSGV
jgi:hypothetical protein